jgi:hypothetical protein
MHGADRDIMWLQRDFHIYVCNLFDTGQVSCNHKPLFDCVFSAYKCLCFLQNPCFDVLCKEA